MSKLYFAATHEWILVDGNKAKIGVSDKAQKELGDLVFVELPAVGTKVFCKKPFCNVESVKAVSEVFSPACGTVIATNEALESNPELINNAPMDSWIIEIELDKLSDSLLSQEDYAAKN